MDWNHQLLASLAWLAKAFVISLLGMTALGTAVSRYTVWGRQFRRITAGYFTPARSVKPLAALAVIVLLALGAVRMDVLFSFWSNGLYSALQKLDAKAFWAILAVFATLATVHVARALVSAYLRQAFLIRWQIWLTETLIARWLANQTYYRSQYTGTHADNPDQRIQQDVDSFVGSSLSLSIGLLEAVVSLFAFSIVLWGLSGTLSLFGVELPHAMVFLVYLYALVATIIALKIGHPLVRLSFLAEKFSANFRYALIRVREYGENIAFYQGEAVERGNLLGRFSAVIGNSWATLFRSLKFQGFNLIINQSATVFPLIVQAPRLFSKQITLGDAMQTSQAFGQVLDSLSFIRTSYDAFAGYRAVLERLDGFLDVMVATEQLPHVQLAPATAALTISALTVHSPHQRLLVEQLDLALRRPTSLLIRGRSGIGKTSTLRAIAGLWPYADGKVARPLREQALFLPQQPYLPLGSLRQALHYPGAVPPPQAGSDAAAAVLRQCQLGHLAAQLDEEDNWGRILSLGEQQRLAIGRVLINRPQIVFLDEASSAMDEGLELAMYELLRTSLPDTILISVGHRSSLLAFHEQQLELLGEGRWRLHGHNSPAMA